jgi:cell division protein FtsL
VEEDEPPERPLFKRDYFGLEETVLIVILVIVVLVFILLMLASFGELST